MRGGVAVFAGRGLVRGGGGVEEGEGRRWRVAGGEERAEGVFVLLRDGAVGVGVWVWVGGCCLLYTSPSPRD